MVRARGGAVSPSATESAMNYLLVTGTSFAGGQVEESALMARVATAPFAWERLAHGCILCFGAAAAGRAGSRDRERRPRETLCMEE